MKFGQGGYGKGSESVLTILAGLRQNIQLQRNKEGEGLEKP